MATLALAAVGAAAGGALMPAGIGILGTTLSGAAIGSQIGSLAGSFVDNAFVGSSGASRAVEGPRLSNLQVTASTEGANIPPALWARAARRSGDMGSGFRGGSYHQFAIFRRWEGTGRSKRGRAINGVPLLCKFRGGPV